MSKKYFLNITQQKLISPPFGHNQEIEQISVLGPFHYSEITPQQIMESLSDRFVLGYNYLFYIPGSSLTFENPNVKKRWVWNSNTNQYNCNSDLVAFLIHSSHFIPKKTSITPEGVFVTIRYLESDSNSYVMKRKNGIRSRHSSKLKGMSVKVQAIRIITGSDQIPKTFWSLKQLVEFESSKSCQRAQQIPTPKYNINSASGPIEAQLHLGQIDNFNTNSKSGQSTVTSPLQSKTEPTETRAPCIPNFGILKNQSQQFQPTNEKEKTNKISVTNEKNNFQIKSLPLDLKQDTEERKRIFTLGFLNNAYNPNFQLNKTPLEDGGNEGSYDSVQTGEKRRRTNYNESKPCLSTQLDSIHRTENLGLPQSIINNMSNDDHKTTTTTTTKNRPDTRTGTISGIEITGNNAPKEKCKVAQDLTLKGQELKKFAFDPNGNENINTTDTLGSTKRTELFDLGFSVLENQPKKKNIQNSTIASKVLSSVNDQFNKEHQLIRKKFFIKNRKKVFGVLNHRHPPSFTDFDFLEKNPEKMLIKSLNQVHHKKLKRKGYKKKNISYNEKNQLLSSASLIFSLSNDPCFSYSMNIINELENNFQFNKYVLYLETHQTRYELSLQKDQLFTLSKVINPTIYNYKKLVDTFIPMKSNCKIITILKWDDIKWSKKSIIFDNFLIHPIKLFWFKRTNSLESFDPPSHFNPLLKQI
ncbi:hypothetical protein M0812_05599 [Anaeramoeba flamelloides]|uniref:Uncharacterized protein n=1 Tax=Anaeramoeba flamelloides TaxID=1746091 RepID=A0AAV8A744_9EUKA|nr:hypothetical protein M0812_05599 [Anaeramoeba flamelloides]